MIPLNRTFAPLQALVDELARCGLSHAVTSPGSRNAPILLTLADDERIEALSVLDERSAGFVALGIAKSTRRPVVVTCTSGTAGANLLPAVIEADEARVPLIVLTADRPPELRDVGAGQAIDQLKLYGSAVKWFVEVGNHEPSRATAVHYRALACRAYFTAAGGRPGPVHLNLALREPLAPVAEELDEKTWSGRRDGRPWVRHVAAELKPPGTAVRDLARRAARSARGALVCGSSGEDIAGPAAGLAATLGWPLLADPTSGARCGSHDRSHVVAHYDALLRGESFARRHGPDLVLRIGDTPTSKPLRAWLERSSQVVVDPHSTWHEPTRAAETIVAASAVSTCEALSDELSGHDVQADPGWIASWREADALVPRTLAAAPDPFEPKVYAALADVLSDGATVWLSSSMPVREVETFFPQTATSLRFLSNRGANGIDGVVSSAAGAAVAADGRCHLLTGELALLHDIGGLLAARHHGIDLTIICVNNGGGGIFDFLPVAETAARDAYEEHIATPSGASLERVAALAGIPHRKAATPVEIQRAAAEPGLVEVATDRAESVRLHREVFARLRGELGDS